MTVNDDFWKGFCTALVVCFLLFLSFSLGSCNVDWDGVHTLPYPSEKRVCVIVSQVVETCYPETPE